MPDTRPGAGSRPPTVSSAATGRGGGGGQNPASSIVQLLADQQGEQMKKLMSAMQDMEKRNSEAIQAATQAGAGAATQVANQVAQGLERSNQQKTRDRERGEDKQFAEDMATMQQKFTQDAMKEAQQMGIALNGQKDAMLSFRQRWQEAKIGHRTGMAAFESRTLKMLKDGKFSSVKGREQLRMRRHHLEMMRDLGQDHFDDRHLEEAYRMHNDSLMAISRGEDGMDLRQLHIEPIDMPFVQLPGNPHNKGKRLVKPGEMSPQQKFNMKMGGGYPPKGVFFANDPDDKMPEGYEPKLMNANTMLKAYAHDDWMRQVEDVSLRDELNRKNKALLIKAHDAMQPNLKTYGILNETYSKRAGGAVERAYEDFLADPDNNKWNDSGRYMFMASMKHIAGGGKQGEEISILAMEIFDGKRELKSSEDFQMAMAMESMSYSIQDQMNSEFMALGEGGESAANQLYEDMKQSGMTEDEIASSLGVPADAVGLVSALAALEGRVAEWSAFAGGAYAGYRNNSILEQFTEKLGDVTREMDLYIAEDMIDGDQKDQRLRKLMGQGAASAATSKNVEGLSGDEVSGALGQFDEGAEDIVDSPFDELGVTIGHMGAMSILSQELGPNTQREMTSWITNQFDPMTTGNMEHYRRQAEVADQTDGFEAGMQQRETESWNRGKAAKKLAQSQAKVAGGSKDIAANFDAGGAAGVMSTLPAWISVGVSNLRGATANVASRTAAGMVQNVAGANAATAAARGSQALLSGTQPVMTPGEAQRVQQSGLSGQEARQVIGESNLGRGQGRDGIVGEDSVLDHLLNPSKFRRFLPE